MWFGDDATRHRLRRWRLPFAFTLLPAARDHLKDST
jgi:hypothetical protein